MSFSPGSNEIVIAGSKSIIKFKYNMCRGATGKGSKKTTVKKIAVISTRLHVNDNNQLFRLPYSD